VHEDSRVLLINLGLLAELLMMVVLDNTGARNAGREESFQVARRSHHHVVARKERPCAAHVIIRLYRTVQCQR